MVGLTVGRMVHYVAYGTPGQEYEPGAHRAAIITDVVHAETGVVSLCILNPKGMFFDKRVPHFEADEHMPGSWHWIERA